MIRNEQQEIELSKFIDKVKERSAKAMDSMETAEQLRQAIWNLCLNCYREVSESCDICLGNAKNEVFLTFDKLRHDWDWDND